MAKADRPPVTQADRLSVMQADKAANSREAWAVGRWGGEVAM